MLYETPEPDQINEAIARLRKEYTQQTLDRDDVDPNPFVQFKLWFDAAVRSHIPEANAMHLATASADGRPSGRMVLLKGFSETGFIFYTNYESRKGAELDANPYAALTFFWQQIERQVRIEGNVRRLSPDESFAYFRSRPIESRIGAWASPQSQVLQNRQELEHRFQETRKQFPEQNPELPPFWGGFQVLPDRFEFWQGRKNRLHDRIRYEKQADGWQIDRLAP